MFEKIKNNKLLIFGLVIIILLIIVIIFLLNNTVSREDYDVLESKFKEQNNANNAINKLASEIKAISNNTTLYVCEKENTLYLEQRNYDVTKNQEIQNEIMKIIGRELNGTLKEYDELVLISYLNSDNKENVQIVREVYDLSTFKKKDEAEDYIRLEEYKDMYNSLIEMYELYN